jgi:hypothetical protein
MIKKSLILLITCSFLVLIINFGFVQKSQAEDIISLSTESAAIDYPLPYPGLLPDSPLYFFKKVRDSIARFFITDSFKKAEFDLLQSDKNINTVYFLSFRKNVGDKLFISRIVESEKAFENAINEITDAKEQGTDVNNLLLKMSLSAQKHRELLTELKSKILLSNKGVIEKGIKKTQDLEERVEEVKSK